MAPTDRHRARQEAVADAVAGALASVVSLWVFYPVDLHKTNVQATSSEHGVRSPPTKLQQRNTWKALFVGWEIKTAHTVTSSFCYFYLYSWIFSWWKRNRTGTTNNARLSTSTRLLLSALAAIGNTMLTLPLDVLAAQQQTAARNNVGSQIEEPPLKSTVDDDDDDDKSDKNDKTSLCLKDRFRKVLSLWKGLYPSLLLCTNPSIHYTVFDMIKARLLQFQLSSLSSTSSLSMPQAFLTGLIAKTVATLVTYPLIRAKVLLMVARSHHDKDESPLMWDCLVREYQQAGWQGLYRGCDLQLIHSVLKSALLMMVRERITRTTHRMLLVPQLSIPTGQE